MVRFTVAASFSVLVLIGPATAFAQSDMSTYGDTLRKNSHTHSAIHPVKRGSASAAKHNAGGQRHAASTGHHHR